VSKAAAEEGDEWECLPCNKMHHELDRLLRELAEERTMILNYQLEGRDGSGIDRLSRENTSLREQLAAAQSKEVCTVAHTEESLEFCQACKIEQLRKEADEDALLRQRMRRILRRTADALHGGSLEDGYWSWHDLPEIAERLRREGNEAAEREALLKTRLADAQEKMARVLRDGIQKAPCPTPKQWKQMQDFATGWLAVVESER
jgi:hypothetical protein